MRTDYNHAPTTRKRIREAAAESSSSWSLGEYAVSPRSDLRSPASLPAASTTRCRRYKTLYDSIPPQPLRGDSARFRGHLKG